MSAPKKEGLKPLKDRTIKELAGDAAKKGMRLQVGIEPLAATPAQMAGRECCYCPRQPFAHWHSEQGAKSAADIGRGQLVGEPTNSYAMTPTNHPTSAEIREVIAQLKTLADTFPGIIHAANGPGLSGSPISTMVALDRACEMLRRHSIDVEKREEEGRIGRERELVQTLFENGIKTGIEQEQARVKEARKGRKRGAKKS